MKFLPPLQKDGLSHRIASNHKMTEEIPHYLGHRERLRDKLLKCGGDSLADYELLELILTMALPRKDVKPLAKTLLNHFRSFVGVMNATPEELMQIKGIKETTAAVLKIIPASCDRLLKQEITNMPALTSWEKIQDYCFLKLAHKRNERFHILFLDTKYRLISAEEHQHGTVNHTPVYPREILSRALALNASVVILVHNHPSGDPKPSEADVKLTMELSKILKMSDITIFDHLIIGKQGIYSFRQNGCVF